MDHNEYFDVIIIGGSYAGLSAAMALGRSMRRVLIIDSGLPCNRQTPYSHNFITQDGVRPAEIADKARSQVLEYASVHIVNDLAVSGKKTESGFTITTQSDNNFNAKKLIFATGIKDIMPPIRGFSECWGISVIHCPYCHGYEFRNQKTGIFSNGDRAFQLTSLVRNLTDDITILTSGEAKFNADQLEKLKKHNVEITEKVIIGIEHVGGQIKNVVFNDDIMMNFDALYS